ncbi:MAG: UDP-N-acetylmuramate dehydrogenase [Bacteroidetes bacterium]|nr:UDP-N-acetylmuramate dehydrogenase [Bacteroidota bacterium]MBS1631328.1 UDP-N-acetylmuramate dehydrogenase [Bacteroidota bacterium]
MKIQENISLKPYNTFQMEVKSRYFSVLPDASALEDQEIPSQNLPMMILGGGSNILFTKDYNGWIIRNEIKGIEEINEDNKYVYVKAGAGENWHRFVLYCISRNWAGIENLSLIPGTVGASPIQNIGAYGVELKDVFYCLEAYHRHDRKIVTLTSSDCEFGYRDSIFKKNFKDQFIILNVTLRLYKHPVFHVDYGAIKQELEKMKIDELSIHAISQAVINIRSSKLPDPEQLGNAGSFFKNPLIQKLQYNSLIEKFPELPSYPSKNEFVKIPAGWLIEHCGPGDGSATWKGFRRADAGCYSQQALVLVNYGKATGSEIFRLSEEISASVKKKFGINLEREVNIV